jgi:hypothetical protein
VSEGTRGAIASTAFVAFMLGMLGGLWLLDCADWRQNCRNACENVELQRTHASERYDDQTGERLSAICECSAAGASR